MGGHFRLELGGQFDRFFHYAWPNLFEMLRFLDKKRIEYPYFVNHKYDVTVILTCFVKLTEFQNVYGYSIQKYFYLAYVNAYKYTGICDMECQEKACLIDLKNNQVIIKMQVTDLALFDSWKPTFNFMSDFMCKIEIEERKTKTC